MWWMLASVAFAACPDEADQVALDAATSIESSFADVDPDGVAAGRERLDAAVVCIERVVTPDEAVRLHRATALLAFMDGDGASARRSLAAVKRLEPGWTLPPALAPTGHPLRALADDAVPGDERVRVELSPPGGWVVDGTETLDVPTRDAFVLQGLDADGLVVMTGLYRSPSEIPIGDVRALADLPKVPARRRRARRIGTVASGGLALVGVGFGVAAQVQAANLDQVPVGEVRQAEKRIRTHGTVAGVLGGVGVIGGIVTWAVPW